MREITSANDDSMKQNKIHQKTEIQVRDGNGRRKRERTTTAAEYQEREQTKAEYLRSPDVDTSFKMSLQHLTERQI